MEKQRIKVKVCLAGEPMVGKTSLIRRYVLDEYDDRYIATLGAKVTKKELELKDEKRGDVAVTMILWDIWGNKNVRELLKDAYYHGAHGIIAVCDVTRPETMIELDGWAEAITSVAGDIPVCLLANKNDMPDRQLREPEIRKFSKDRNWPAYLTSAKTGDFVEDAFGEIVRTILNPAGPS
ncbi:MAG TPA: Rab family GTPase [Thermoplasmata archaeon]|nr:Rab family GTPase [Thermoplasmata archaeon]